MSADDSTFKPAQSTQEVAPICMNKDLEHSTI